MRRAAVVVTFAGLLMLGQSPLKVTIADAAELSSLRQSAEHRQNQIDDLQAYAEENRAKSLRLKRQSLRQSKVSEAQRAELLEARERVDLSKR